MDLEKMISIVLLFLACISITTAKSVKAASCKIMDIPLQEDFDLDKFEGRWFATMKTGIKDSVLSYFTEIYDGKVLFKTNLAGGFDIKAAGSKFYGGWCPKGKGYAAIKDTQHPERMTMYFDTSIGRRVGMKPAWLVKTDYTSYAVFYSCWEPLSSGVCDPAKTYAFVVQRSNQPLSENQQGEIIEALKYACIDFSDLSPVKHYGYCVGSEGF